jgi:phenylpyruvate tautomerase PptA (4-oxalocrotonate tautomerase family)
MPYLRITSPELPLERRRVVAECLTGEVCDLFFDPRAPVTREQLRERTTVHFTPYRDGELFIAGRTPDERGASDVTVELSDWSMSARQQRRVADRLTRMLAELFGFGPSQTDDINIRFHPYPPKDFAVGGQLLSDRIPLIGRVMKRLQVVPWRRPSAAEG